MGRSGPTVKAGADGPAFSDPGVYDGFNQTLGWRSIIVVPISTSSSQGKRGPTVIELSGGIAGLPKTSFAVCHQVTTLDRAKMTKRIGALPLESLRAVDEGLKAAMDLD